MDFSGLPEGAPARPRLEGQVVRRGASRVQGHEVRSWPTCPTSFEPRSIKVALEAYRALRVRDYGRVDLRLTPTGDIYVIEVNANCYLERSGEFAVAAEAAGIGYDELIGRLVGLAVERHKKDR